MAKFRVRRQEVEESEKVIEFWLGEQDGIILLCAKSSIILRIKPDGTLSFDSNLPEDLGLRLSSSGKIIINE